MNSAPVDVPMGLRMAGLPIVVEMKQEYLSPVWKATVSRSLENFEQSEAGTAQKHGR